MLSLVLSALGMAGTQPTIAVANGFDANASAIPNLTIGKLGSCSCQVPKDYEPRLRVCIAEVLRTALTVALWALLSLSLSYYNSWLLQDVKATESNASHPGFVFPLFYTMVQMIFQVVAIGSLFLFVPETVGDWLSVRDAFREHWRLVVLLGGVCSVRVGGENSETSLSFSESIKSLMPLIVMLLAFEGRRYGPTAAASIVMQSAGATMVAIGASSEGTRTQSTPLGILLTSFATLGASLNPVIAALLMRHEANSVRCSRRGASTRPKSALCPRRQYPL